MTPPAINEVRRTKVPHTDVVTCVPLEPLTPACFNSAHKLKRVSLSFLVLNAAASSMSKPRLMFEPYAHALNDTELHRCWNCLVESTTSLSRCSGCKTAHFCSKQCLLNGWPDHKPECKAFKASKTVPAKSVRMLGRICTRYLLDVKNPEKMDVTRPITALCSHIDDIKNDENAMQRYFDTAAKLKQFYAKKYLPDDTIIFWLDCICQINTVAIQTGDNRKSIGTGLYLGFSAYDHSCIPNALYFFKGSKVEIILLDEALDIHDTSKVFIEYVDLLQPRKSRREQLKGRWYFECECERCSKDSDVLNVVRCGCGISVPIAHKACGCGEKLNTKESSRAISQISKMLDNAPQSLGNLDKIITETNTELAKVLPPENVNLCRLYREITNNLLNSGASAAKVVSFCENAQPGLDLCFPKYHTVLTHHQIALSGLLSQVGREKDSLIAIVSAVEAIRAVNGDGVTGTYEQFYRWVFGTVDR